MGAQIYSRITGLEVVGPDDYTCGTAHQPTDPWWQRRVSLWWGMCSLTVSYVLADVLSAFLTVPLFSLVLSLRNQAPMWRKEMVGHSSFCSCRLEVMKLKDCDGLDRLRRLGCQSLFRVCVQESTRHPACHRCPCRRSGCQLLRSVFLWQCLCCHGTRVCSCSMIFTRFRP